MIHVYKQGKAKNKPLVILKENNAIVVLRDSTRYFTSLPLCIYWTLNFWEKNFP